ncbi:metal ABC transporter permease [Paenibacillus sacheonensis]|uniref:Iron chelate uptake ABC transporter family permease subunit n=1 Tax=Paenibacillus sacheonensis TaxID=742054 RepID=A0A7X4YUM3_9BACL|nr:metal ABC transporter permease [Paenibacillus sacheonensis]MBM7567241.1 manganese/zinc/iron transport system permease protein [Paenibacillus sacheonensis]NBC72863.1 iron chelate uptake ABC transporter family permease subunit [Paenibacillus sacheonensis]
MSTLWIILTGALVASTCGIVGCFLVLRRMAMIGDAISHSVLPGIVIAFLISGSRDSLFMLLGAAVLGLVTVFLIQLFHQSGVQSDASIGVVFTALFAVGVVLVSMYTKHIDLDLDCVLYGEIAYVPWNTIQLAGIDIGPKAVWGVGLALLLTILLISVFYKQFKLCSFDPALAAAVGIPVALFHYLLMGLVSVSTVASFESVGAILVVGMLVVPPAAAYLLTERLSRMIVYSVVIGCFSSVLGYYAAHLLDASIAGCMISVAGVIFLLALLFSPGHGIVFRKWNRRQQLSS